MSAEAVAESATNDAPRLKGRTNAHFSMEEVGAPFLHGEVRAGCQFPLIGQVVRRELANRLWAGSECYHW